MILQQHVLGRRSGKTTQAVDLVRNVRESLLVVASEGERDRLIRQYGLDPSQVLSPNNSVTGRLAKQIVVDDADDVPLDRLQEISKMSTKLPDGQMPVLFASEDPWRRDRYQNNVPPRSTGPHDTIYRMLRAEGMEVADVRVEMSDVDFSYDIPHWRVEIRLADGLSIEAEVPLSRSMLDRGRANWVDYIAEAVAKDVLAFWKRETLLADADAALLAVDLVGFEREEIKAARLIPMGSECRLEVDLHETDWEPDYILPTREVTESIRKNQMSEKQREARQMKVIGALSWHREWDGRYYQGRSLGPDRRYMP